MEKVEVVIDDNGYVDIDAFCTIIDRLTSIQQAIIHEHIARKFCCESNMKRATWVASCTNYKFGGQNIPSFVVSAIRDVWGKVYADAGIVDTNEEAIELCLDAERLLLLGNHVEANKFICTWSAKHGPNTLIAALSERIKLV